MLEEALSLAHNHHASAEADLLAELRIPSISALSDYRADVRSNAEWLGALLTRIGFDISLIDIPGERHPILRADLIVDSRKPILTIYGHYDVQPVDPLDEWVTGPFEPNVRGALVYARGAADNKGNHMAAIKAAEYAQLAGGSPLNLRFLIEGEEEIVGNALGRYVREEARDLATDYLLVLDGSFDFDDTPTLVTGLRGVLHVELDATGPSIDLHSGIYGGVAPNPINTLARVIASLKDEGGRITIPGFYDGVSEPSDQDRTAWRRASDYSAALMRTMGVQALEGERGYSPVERQWARPTLDLHGITGGFGGEGVKTVIPSHAMAKLSMRLVPGQDVEAIWASLHGYVNELTTPGVRIKATRLASTRPLLIDSQNRVARAVRKAFERAFGKQPRVVRSGGSIPVALDLHEALGAPMVVTGLAQPGSGQHSPNEHMSLDHFHRGTHMLIELIHELPASEAAAGDVTNRAR